MNKLPELHHMPLSRALAFYEIYKQILTIKGSVVECGVASGVSLNMWISLHRLLEPLNKSRRFYGFDTFEGFPSTAPEDRNEIRTHHVGDLNFTFNREAFLAHHADLPVYEKDGVATNGEHRVELIRGDILETLPDFRATHQQLVVALLMIDVDLYAPTKAALEHILPRMSKGGIIVFDEPDFALWPGETQAIDEVMGLREYQMHVSPLYPQHGYIVL